MDNTHEIKEARRKLRELEATQETHKRQTSAQRVAEGLHDVMCQQNHSDDTTKLCNHQCSWHYDIWPTNSGEHSARAIYMNKAVRLLEIVDNNVDKAEAIIGALTRL